MGGVERISLQVALLFSTAACIGWVALLVQPKGWIKKQSTIYTIDCGLDEVTLSEGVVQAAITGLVSMASQNLGSKLGKLAPRGTYTLQNWSQRMCSLNLIDFLPGSSGSSQGICSLWRGMQTASTIMVICAPIGLVCHFIGTCLLCYWFFIKARASVRIWARSLLLLGVLVLVASTGQYVWMAGNLEYMPPSEGGSPLGPNVMYAMIMCTVAAVPLVVSLLALGASTEEMANESASERKHLAREQGKLYGAADQEAPAEGVPSQGNMVWGSTPQDAPVGPSWDGAAWGGAGYGQPQAYSQEYAQGYAQGYSPGTGPQDAQLPLVMAAPENPQQPGSFGLPPPEQGVSFPYAQGAAQGAPAPAPSFDLPAELRRGPTTSMPALPPGA